jgi:hypothetical protein
VLRGGGVVAEGSFIRWQATTIDQFGRALRFFLALAGASLAFAVAVVKDYHPTCWSKPFMLASIALLMLSMLLGLWCVINRLRDFRITQNIVRDRERWRSENIGRVDKIEKEEIDRELGARRAEVKRLGEISWWLLCCQIGSFGLGVIFLISAFGIAYREALF